MLRYKNIVELLVIGTYKQTGDQIYLQTPHCCTFVPSLNFPVYLYRVYCAILGHLIIMLFYHNQH